MVGGASPAIELVGIVETGVDEKVLGEGGRRAQGSDGDDDYGSNYGVLLQTGLSPLRIMS